MKMIQVTPSKQWIHFFLSDLCPPTSNILQGNRSRLCYGLAIQCRGKPHWSVSSAPLFRNSPEVQVFEAELGLNDTGGLHSWSQHILLSGNVAWLDQSLQVVQVTEVENDNIILNPPDVRLWNTSKSQPGWFLTIQRSRWAGTLRPCRNTPECRSPSTGGGWCRTTL